ncbi:hypothetical protein [Streptomyces sp. L2]|uniref:hypothetical protein n=1 Tax=Streptomyces sp. L2 TaxID=2162665 RepID=UPI00101166B1|nr:hypothetical protein [Streptomyces sp. L2]
MTELIRLALTLILPLLLPPTGRRRRRDAPTPPRTLTGLRLLIHRTALPLAFPPRIRMHGHHDAPLADNGPLVRPYLRAHEEEEARRERRAALVLALEGIDVGPWIIHGHRVGTPVAVAA